eukprot:TRINITY_DN108_c0_g1_i2.p1 TRINITY_DN108_c0_g1~~TRINITY_DN108_c0_g1_i2.p1  ORF type:complete len:648 (+),score=163.32 TRINITY_DN108_c0_g1_i2:1023-2966(+)
MWVDVQFLRFYLHKIIEQINETEKRGTGGMGLIDYVYFQRTYRLASHLHQQAIFAGKQFWGLLLNEGASLDDLELYAERFDDASSRAAQEYERLLLRYPNSKDLVRSYGQFISEVQRNEAAAQLCFQLADELEERESRAQAALAAAMKSKFTEAKFTELTSKQLLDWLDNFSEAVVVADPAGTIAGWNARAWKIFGYRNTEAVGQNVRMLVPEPHKSYHDAYLLHAAEVIAEGKESAIRELKVLDKIRQMNAAKKGGVLVPVVLVVRRLADGCFVALIAEGWNTGADANGAPQAQAELASSAVAAPAALKPSTNPAQRLLSGSPASTVQQPSVARSSTPPGPSRSNSVSAISTVGQSDADPPRDEGSDHRSAAPSQQRSYAKQSLTRSAGSQGTGDLIRMMRARMLTTLRKSHTIETPTLRLFRGALNAVFLLVLAAGLMLFFVFTSFAGPISTNIGAMSIAEGGTRQLWAVNYPALSASDVPAAHVAVGREMGTAAAAYRQIHQTVYESVPTLLKPLYVSEQVSTQQWSLGASGEMEARATNFSFWKAGQDFAAQGAALGQLLTTLPSSTQAATLPEFHAGAAPQGQPAVHRCRRGAGRGYDSGCRSLGAAVAARAERDIGADAAQGAAKDCRAGNVQQLPARVGP